MGKKYRRYRNFIEKYLASEKGKRFFHVVYSLGAAIVILGALFKINHYAIGGTMLLIGMVTEAIVFILSAFDAPSKEYKWEEAFPVLATNNKSADTDSTELPYATGPRIQGAGGTIVINGGGNGSGKASTVATGSEYGIAGGGFVAGGASSVASDTAEVVEASEKYAEQLSKASENMEKFAAVTNSLALSSEALLSSFSSISDNSDDLGNNTKGYINQMEALNRNLTGLNTIYEIQLKGVSGQINTIDQINAGLERIKHLYDGSLIDSSVFKTETEKMAQQLAELNRVYARMLQAMTVNMNMGMPGYGTMPNTQQDEK